MTTAVEIAGDKSFDALSIDPSALKEIPELSEIVTTFLNGDYKAILRNPTSQALFEKLAKSVEHSSTDEGQKAAAWEDDSIGSASASLVLISGLAAFNAFLQANVTGPPLDLRDVLQSGSSTFRDHCLRSLDVDGVSVYQHIPHVELFCLARMVFTAYFPRIIEGSSTDCKWMRIRVNAYHQRLLSGASVGKLMDTTSLQNAIEKDLKDLEKEILAPGSSFSTEAKVQFLLEKAQIHIMQGLDLKAQDDLKMAKTESGFSYALSGALGKRTKFQQKDISQLVVFAKSRESDDSKAEPQSTDAPIESGTSKDDQDLNSTVPEALQLNDDTLLESIEFSKPTSDQVDISSLPPALAGMQPDQQPQLNPLDQITLLTEATLKDALTPFDKLNSEEILPYAVRVLSDKPTNWQIYTQALLVRSRIESHRSRTQERSVLQMQVIVDQIIADTQEEATSSPDELPEIRVTQFLPRAQASESAPVPERLKYIFQLNTPTRWELETELAFAWSNAGSFVSALEIFKRLKLWPEVALCYHSVDQVEKARRIVRRQLYYSSKGPEMDNFDVDAAEVASEKWDGEMRSPPPPHAPRLWCILGDIDSDPECWERAWEISNHRYARAQRTLGEYWSRTGDLDKAREAYLQATIVNRQNSDSWSRLGDIDLRVGNWDGAIIAFQQSIMIDDTDAKTYSNLGSALLSKHAELVKLQKVAGALGEEQKPLPIEIRDDEENISQPKGKKETPQDFLRQALSAYKRGAAIAYDNWKIWDNAVTIASRMNPPSFPDIVMGTKNVIRIRAPTVGEEAIDLDILRALIAEVITRDRGETDSATGIYTPPRGSLARAVIQMVESDIVPLITTRAELWTLSEKLALYCRDYARALSCAEKAWRMLTQSADEAWLTDREKWKEVVRVTDDLVSAYENYGTMEKEDGELVEKAWKMKARSAIRGVMGRAKDSWEDTEEWETLKELLAGLKS
ncbi:putative TPR repeat-containing protein [Venustampulla echinocandica]|uniref:Putative TPR repeat-containing protein n=1 Tax=Venustampulla echinocandica TaxID=2656787 RepID=A0A370TAJ2_9HELO|nr:putative TPR repeat-containing protein [Venustampulla echinocandica]RDL30812.1 putative TPR repeat-containing protein [Venustampulla echinocandica]